MIKRRTQGRWRSGWVGWIAGLFLLAHTVVGQVQVPLAGAGGAVAQPLLPPQAKAALLKIDGTIDRVTLKSLERRVDEARKAGCTLVIYDLQVTGGYMPSALDISAFTKHVTGEQMSVAAWVHGNASGAASVVALACPLIVMADGAGLGSIAAEDLAPAGVAPSPLVTDLEDSAKRAGIDRAVVRAMAIPAVELIAVTNRTTGETRYVDRANEKILLDERIAAPGGEVTRPWAESAVVDGPDSTLTVLSDDALKMHLSRATVNSEADLRATLNVRGDLVKMDLDIFERIARWLAQPWVRFLLLVGTLTFAWVELSHPGVSVPGVLAIICLALLLGGPFLTGLAQSWEIILVLVGIGIVLLDLFVVGSVGMLAVPGFVLITVGLVASFIPRSVGGGLDYGEGLVSLRNGLAIVIMAMAVSVVAFGLMARYLRLTPGFRRLQLLPAARAAGNSDVRDAADRPAGEAVFVGALGLAHSQLRPAGKARFDQHLVDVVSFGPFISAGTEIEVVSVSGSRVTVRPRRPVMLEPQQPPATDGGFA